MFYRILTIIGGLILLASTIFVVVNWGQIPDQIPTHFTITGQPDAYGGKPMLIFLVVISWVMFILLTISVKFPRMWNFPVEVTDENRDVLFAIARFMMEILKFLTAILMAVIMMATALSINLSAVVMVSLFAAIIATIAVCMYLMFKNK